MIKTEVKITDIIAMLDEGKTRKEIATSYGMPLATLNSFFKNPKLAGKRAKKQTGFELVDDTRVYPEVQDTEELFDNKLEEVPVTNLSQEEHATIDGPVSEG